MANEAIRTDGSAFERVLDFTVADGIGISKGTLMSGLDLRGAVAGTTADVGFAGITAADKEISDEAVNVGLHQYGVFDLTSLSGIAIAVNQMVKLSGINLIVPAVDADYEAGLVVGKALEAAAAATEEQIEVLINL